MAGFERIFVCWEGRGFAFGVSDLKPPSWLEWIGEATWWSLDPLHRSFTAMSPNSRSDTVVRWCGI